MAQTAIVFAGQGAQFVGMGKDLAEAYPVCRALFTKADEVLGYPISRICFEGPAEELTKSNHCQPAIFVVSMACYAAMLADRPGTVFGAAAGLSLGEWSALHMAGVLTFEDTLRVLEARGRFMQEACDAKAGGMLSVMGLAADKIAKICADAGVQVSNLNSPEQTVLSGTKEGVQKAEELARQAGASRIVALNVAGAYHSALMAPAAARLEQFLAGIRFKDPVVPVISNVTGAPHGKADTIPGTMVRQVTSTVQWVAGIGHLKASGVDRYVECGPGRVLSGLIKRLAPEARLHNVQDIASLKKTAAEIGGV